MLKLAKIRQLKWRWGGRVARRNDNRLIEGLTEWHEWQPRKRKGRDKEMGRWGIILQLSWKRKDEDMCTWKEREEGYTFNILDEHYDLI